MGWKILKSIRLIISKFTCMKNSERTCKLSEYFWVYYIFQKYSEKCSNLYKNYKKNFHQGIVIKYCTIK